MRLPEDEPVSMMRNLQGAIERDVQQQQRLLIAIQDAQRSVPVLDDEALTEAALCSHMRHATIKKHEAQKSEAKQTIQEESA